MHVPGDILGIVIWLVEMIRSDHVDILFFFNVYFFILMCQVLFAAYRSLVLACGILSYSMWNLTRDSNPGPLALEVQNLSHLTNCPGKSPY